MPFKHLRHGLWNTTGNFAALKDKLPNIINFDLDETNRKGALATLDTEDDDD